MPTTEDPPTEASELAIVEREKIQQQLTVITTAIEVALGVREITPEAKARVATLSAAAFAFTVPPLDDEEQERISAARRALAAVRIGITKQSDAYKSVLNAPRQTIIDITKKIVETIEKAERHCQGLENARQQRLVRERQEREEAAAREQKRIADEQAAAQRAIEDANRQRLAAKEAARQAESLKGKKKAEAEAEAARLADEARRAEENAIEQSLALETAAPSLPVAPVSDLTMAKEFNDFELIGFTESAKAESLRKLIYAHPQFATYKIADEKPRSYSITLKISDVVDRLNGRDGRPAADSLPGIKVVKRLTRLR